MLAKTIAPEYHLALHTVAFGGKQEMEDDCDTTFSHLCTSGFALLSHHVAVGSRDGGGPGDGLQQHAGWDFG